MIHQKMKQEIQKRKPEALKMLKSRGIHYLRNSWIVKILYLHDFFFTWVVASIIIRFY